MTIDELVDLGTSAQVLGSGYGFTEGPAADGGGNVYFSDGKQNSIHLYRAGEGVSLFVDDSTDANGMVFNRQGELLVCEGAASRVVAFDIESRRKRILVSQFEGLRFNEPNDLAVDYQGGVYFSDPNYQHHGQPTVRKEDVYYLSADGQTSRVSTVAVKPNGLLLSEDDKTLFLADSRGQFIYRYKVAGPGILTDERRWAALGANPDGMTLDREGNLYVCCGQSGVKVLAADGRFIGAIDAAFGVEYASNCCFGGPDFSTLYITSRQRFLGLAMRVAGIRPWPARNC